MKTNDNKIKKGDRIRVCLNDGMLDEVVYTVQSTKNKKPIILDNWVPIEVESWVRVP